MMKAMSPPVTGAGAASESDAAGLGEPLLANGNDGTGGVQAGALASAAVANGHGGDEPDAKKKGAVNAKDRHWEDVARPESAAEADLESGGDRPLLFRNRKVKNGLLYPYRALIVTRLIAVILLIVWRIRHNNSDVVWFWATSIVGDVWFGLSWLLYQVPKFNPIKRVPDLAAFRQHCDLPDGSSELPGIDAVVTTANPTDEPILYTMNCVLSVLAADYPADRYTCYLSDDSGELILYEALAEASNFATLWVPFCRKHCVEPRAPESYFETQGLVHSTGRSPEEFMSDYKHVRAEYEEFKVRLDTLSSTIRQRSDACNSLETKEGDAKATWMATGTQWPGAWIDPTENHRKGNHAGIVQIVRDHRSRGADQLGPQPQVRIDGRPLNFDDVDARLPMLVYVAREKSACCDHNKKAGALNAQLRISALLSNAQFVINFDCDHYINNSKALRAAMCFMLDRREGDSTAFVQFPQRFDNVDPTDRYGNHNRVFFDGAMYGLNGLQGPTYLGTGCIFRRLALYGFGPPCWGPDGIAVDSDKFGSSTAFLSSVLAAMKQERRVTPPPLDEESFVAEMTAAVSASYDKGTDWGRGVGYIYRIATEDIVTGFRIHGQGWRSMYCTMEPDAFRGTAPINLTERLYQIVRWSGGSLEMFFSHNNPLFAGHRLSLLQRVSYVNFTVYPITSVFILIYALCPLMWLLPEEILIQRPFTRYVAYLVVVILMIHTIGMFEMKWAGITWLDWWRNEQFFVIGSTSAYPTAVLHMTVKLLTNKGIYFRVTSKQTAADTDDKFAGLYEMRWAPMLIPSAMVLSSNVMAIGVAIGKAVLYMGTWSAAERRRAALGMLFNLWIMALLHPFALAVIGRWGRRPSILCILLLIAFVVVGLMYIGIHLFLIHFLPFMVI